MRIPGIILSFLTAVSVSASVSVTENTAQRLSFVFDLEGLSISTYGSGGSTFSSVSFDGSNATLYEEGNVAIPSMSLYSGVPQSGSITATFVSHSVKRITLDHPLRGENEDTVSLGYTPPVFDNPWMSKVRYIHFRGMRTGHLFIKPFIYDPQTRVLTVLLKGSCTITFPSGAARPSPSRVAKSDYYEMVRSLILNYDVAKNWIFSQRQPPGRHKAKSILPANEDMLRFQIGDGNDGENEATTLENGIIKITGNDISSFFGSVDINTIALFGSYREELDSVVPQVADIPAGAQEIPIARFDLNGNGLFDDNDYILAYVTGISDWHDYSDSLGHDFIFYLNRFESYRQYWIRTTGNSNTIKPFACNAVPTKTLNSFVNKIKYKRSIDIQSISGGSRPKGNKNWIWKRLDKNSLGFSYKPEFPDRMVDSLSYLKINPGSHSSYDPVTVFFGDSLDSAIFTWKPLTNWSDSLLTIELVSPDVFFEIVSIDIKYRRLLDMSGKNSLRIYSPLEYGIVSYQLSNIPLQRTFIFRISADESVVSLVDTVLTGGTYSWVDTAGIGVQYFVCTESGFISTPQMEEFNKVNNTQDEIRDLRNGSNSADYLIITHPDFKTEAENLLEHKKKAGKFSDPKITYVEDIYREFSGGNQDPAAIRNFLLYTHNSPNWSVAPDYVLFLGSGHYDYKGYSTLEINYIPTAQYFDRYWKCVEDFFSCIIPGEFVINDTVAPDLFLGRIPCLSIFEAKSVVDKIIETEGEDADYGAWRNRLLLISDDDLQGGGQQDYIQHYTSNEAVEDIAKGHRPSLEIRKVYLFEYEWNEIYQKPEASAAFFNEIDNGVAFANFFGHGNDKAWTDEGILNKDMLGNFHNSGHYPVISAFSCAVGYFDNPDETCLAGLLVKLVNSGAIATVSSSRTAFASANTAMAKTFFDYLYDKQASRTLGQAFALTKAVGTGDRNLKHYILLGDPSIRHMNITDSAQLEILTEDGLPVDTLKALQRIIVKGNIVRNNITNNLFGTTETPAYVQIRLCNPEQDSVRRKDGGTFTNPPPLYSLPGTPVFIGVTEVKNGRFEQKIQLPRRLTFEKPGVTLTAYAFNNKEWFGTGHRGDYLFSGSIPDSSDDREGPRITIHPVYDNDAMWNTAVGFTDKISAFLPLECEINIWDESGIDLTGIGPDEGLSIEIEGVKERENINHKFMFDEGEFTKGRANIVFERGEFKPGKYEMCIRAQDMLSNVSSNMFTLEILSDEDFKLGHVFNYPNPVRMNGKTKFYFYHSNLSEFWHGGVQATIKIFTLSGKLIRIFRDAKNGEEWDLTDQRGHTLGPNVYLYRVSAKMLSTGLSGKEKTVTSSIKKLVIHPPR